jgi:3-hydroxybutyryl-CoA dehydrogenase
MAIQNIGVVGAGTMGSGIAQTCAINGLTVVIHDMSNKLLETSEKIIEHSLGRLLSKGTINEVEQSTALNNIHSSTDLDSLSKCDLIIEAATENMDTKLLIFEALTKICPFNAILASNTSSLSLTTLAAATDRPDKVIGMHFFNPVPLMKLVEIVRALQTSDATYRTIESLARVLGKEPVSVTDSPGFVVNRMLIPMVNEAIFVLYEGLATAEEIDTAMKLGANHPIGPLALADMIGIDVCLYVMNTLLEEFGDSKFRACPLLKQMVNAGYLGRKTKRGFFEYPK